MGAAYSGIRPSRAGTADVEAGTAGPDGGAEADVAMTRVDSNGRALARFPPGLFVDGSPRGAATVRACPAFQTSPQVGKVQRTCTLKSFINLKKHSVRMVPDPSNPALYQLSFTFDALRPCRASIYILGYEKYSAEGPPRIKSRFTKGGIKLGIFDKGLGQEYRQKEGSAFRLPKEEELATVVPPLYPIVIRIQTVDPAHLHKKDKLKEESPSIPLRTNDAAVAPAGQERTAETAAEGAAPAGEDLNKGSAEEPHTLTHHTQTSFATLVKQSDGSYEGQIVKQVASIDGYSYVMHDIFGISGSLEEKPLETLDCYKECVICLSEIRTTLSLPCRHLCMCLECAKALRFQTQKCPICRCTVESLLYVDLKNDDIPN